MYRISYRFLVPGWSAKPLVSAHDRIMGTHRQRVEAQQQLLWPSSWKLAALATCHGIICEDRVGYVSARDCTVVQAESES